MSLTIHSLAADCFLKTITSVSHLENVYGGPNELQLSLKVISHRAHGQHFEVEGSLKGQKQVRLKTNLNLNLVPYFSDSNTHFSPKFGRKCRCVL